MQWRVRHRSTGHSPAAPGSYADCAYVGERLHGRPTVVCVQFGWWWWCVFGVLLCVCIVVPVPHVFLFVAFRSLEKESHNVFKKKWQERYFYYHSPEQRLYYFERRPDTEAANFLKHAKGSIALERRKVIRKEAESLDFEIKDCTANKSYPLRAKNEEEKHRWLTELSQVGFGAPPPGVPLGADKGSRTGSGAAFDSPYGASDNSITKLSGVALSTIARESIEPGLGFRS